MNTPTTNNKQDKLYFRIVMTLSIIVFVAVIVLNRKVIPRPDLTPSFVYFLPMLNAIINGTCCVLLLISLWFIKRKNIAMHKRINITTFILSSVFLVSYVLFHYFVDNTLYPDNGYKGLYYAVLIPHIILAALVLPLILLSFYHGLKMNVTKHKKLVRFAYPIWLFVTASGVAVYLMISPYYKF
ncbi:MAG: DUF420 domain-containing protein [Bacteroidia bacterium]|nr:DUF420 domain-containing protein [Bacteroidia bacterium]MBP9689722.1 DUF420 domain-containing protein [Bacteroidia bacterium]